MGTDEYRTIEAPSEGLFKDRGSRFIGLAHPVSDENEVKQILAGIKKQYYDATHHCYAYRLGAEKELFRSNDDGEPSGSAGKPILGQIQSRDLTNILIVVIRYYGGVKLGVSGLINAYRTAATDALDHARVIEKTVDVTFDVLFDYLAMNDVMRIIKDEEIKQLEHDFALSCRVKLIVRKRDVNRITEAFRKIKLTEVKI